MTENPYENRAFRGAWLDGFNAAAIGHSLGCNPYRDVRTDRGGVTWARGFIRAWDRGHAASGDDDGTLVLVG